MFIVSDLDGTLANDLGRAVFLEKDPPDWDAYFRMCVGDKPISKTIEVLNNLGEKHRVEIWTGRSAVVRWETELWLKHNGVHYNALRMRPEGLHISSVALKTGWMREFGLPDIMLDDRSKDVREFRSMGITVWQVTERNY